MSRPLAGIARLAAVTALAVTGVVAGAADSRAITFNPTATVVEEHPVAGANADVVITTDFPAGGSIFGSFLTFIPGSFGVGECAANNPAGVTKACADEAVPNGALVGKVESTTVLGLLNGQCTSVLTPSWNLMDATTDINDTVVFHDTDGNGVGEQFEDADGNGLPDGVDKYPEYLTRLLRNHFYNPLDPGASQPLQPIQRTYGQAVVGGDDVSLGFVLFPPGTMINDFQPDPAWGFMSVLVIQDTGDPGRQIEPSSITDFCAPNHSVTTLYGITRNNPATAANEGGHKYITNPAAGPTGSIALPSSEYDADDDGIENPLDTCPFDGNPDGWDPRSDSFAGDNDEDGIPNVCDPSPNSANADQDGDGFQNRGDNCPNDSNPNQFDLDRDDIGAVCDENGDTNPGANVAVPIQWGAMFEAAIQGDTNCDGDVTSVDALMSLRHVAALEPFAGCIFVGGDANCDAAYNAIDALAVLRHVAGLTVSQQPGCTHLGDPLS